MHTGTRSRGIQLAKSRALALHQLALGVAPSLQRGSLHPAPFTPDAAARTLQAAVEEVASILQQSSGVALPLEVLRWMERPFDGSGSVERLGCTPREGVDVKAACSGVHRLHVHLDDAVVDFKKRHFDMVPTVALPLFRATATNCSGACTVQGAYDTAKRLAGSKHVPLHGIMLPEVPSQQPATLLLDPRPYRCKRHAQECIVGSGVVHGHRLLSEAAAAAEGERVRRLGLVTPESHTVGTKSRVVVIARFKDKNFDDESQT